MLALVAAILGGLLAMHTMSAEHGLDSSMTRMGHESQAIAGSDASQPGRSRLRDAGSMAMLACILALLTVAVIAAAAPPSPVRSLDPSVIGLGVHLRSPGWGFSLPPPSLVLLSINRR